MVQKQSVECCECLKNGETVRMPTNPQKIKQTRFKLIYLKIMLSTVHLYENITQGIWGRQHLVYYMNQYYPPLAHAYFANPHKLAIWY